MPDAPDRPLTPGKVKRRVLWRAYASLCVAGIAWAVGEGLGLPVWRTWEPIDRADMALLAFMATFILSRPRNA